MAGNPRAFDRRCFQRASRAKGSARVHVASRKDGGVVVVVADLEYRIYHLPPLNRSILALLPRMLSRCASMTRAPEGYISSLWPFGISGSSSRIFPTFFTVPFRRTQLRQMQVQQRGIRELLEWTELLEKKKKKRNPTRIALSTVDWMSCTIDTSVSLLNSRRLIA